MSFLVSSPEVTSAQMYAGAGPAPMLAAAAAWDGLADELGSAAKSFTSLLSDLTASAWQGPAALAMAAVAKTYAEWLGGAASHAGGAATGARAVASIYEAARAAVVHPVEIAVNRNNVVSLAIHNIFGINAPAIAAKEFEYEEMWARDVAAMVGYHGGAVEVARQLVPWQSALKSLPGQVAAATGIGVAALPPAPAATAVEYGLIAALIGVGAIGAISTVGDQLGKVGYAVGTAFAPATKAVTTAAAAVAASANAAVAPVAKAIAETPVVAAANAAITPVVQQIATSANGVVATATGQLSAIAGSAQDALAQQLATVAANPQVLNNLLQASLANPALLNQIVPLLANNPALVTTAFGLLSSNPQLVMSLVAQVQSNPALAAQLFGAFAQLQASNPALAAQLVELAKQLGSQLGIGQAA